MKKIISLIFLVGLFAWLPLSAKASERITDFSSDIAINNNGSLTVKETISAVAEHQKISHGIYRDLILDYQGPDPDHYYQAVYTILSVKRDGQAEPYHLEKIGHNLRIYLGDENNLVPIGDHVYELTYKAYGLMRYFEQADELYWNVTGNNWEFPIERTEARVSVPWQRGDYDNFYSYIDFYTGVLNSQNRDAVAGIDNEVFVYTVNSTLSPGEGFSIVLGFPSGRINKLLPELKEVDPLTKFLNSLDRSERMMIMLVFSLLVLVYFILIWLWRGRDSRPGTIIPQYEAPAGLSPGDVAHIVTLGGGFDKILGSLIVSLAVKGKIKITKQEDFWRLKKWQLDKINKDASNLTDDEKLLFDNLFKAGDQLILPSTDNDLSLFMNWTFRPFFRKKWAKVAYINNTAWVALGVFLVLLLALSYLILDYQTIFIYMFSFFPLVIILIVIFSIAKRLKGSKSILILIPSIFIVFLNLAVGLFIISLFFKSFPNYSISLAFFQANPHLAAFFAVIVAQILVFKFIKKPTIEGRRLLDEIEGFKLFLVTTEKDRMDFFHPIDKTPETFEKYFPYAIALGVADKWAARFENLFQGTDGQVAYAPVWYVGGLTAMSGVGEISSIGSSLGSSLGSSGSGGGGSGGGGGGGGGGGW